MFLSAADIYGNVYNFSSAPLIDVRLLDEEDNEVKLKLSAPTVALANNSDIRVSGLTLAGFRDAVGGTELLFRTIFVSIRLLDPRTRRPAMDEHGNTFPKPGEIKITPCCGRPATAELQQSERLPIGSAGAGTAADGWPPRAAGSLLPRAHIDRSPA